MPDSTIPAWLQVVSAVSAVVIGGAAVWIGRQQWKTAELQRVTSEKRWKHERYDRRIKVYQEVMKILSLIITSAHPDVMDLIEFRKATAEAGFIFGPNIQQYIEEIYKKGVELYSANQQYRDATQVPHPAGYNHAAAVDKMGKALEWFGGQFNRARELFRPYLDISD